MIDKLAIALISPLGCALALSLVALCLLLFRYRRSAQAVTVIAFVWLWLWSLPGVSNGLLARLENQHPPQAISALPSAPAIVVLGGGLTATDFATDIGQPVNLGAAADRVWFAARLYHAGKAPLVVASGGNFRPGAQRTEAEGMALVLGDLGVPDTAIALETLSRNTRDNANFTGALLRQRGINRVLLVTSALHMERARRHFVAAGIEVIPAATDSESRRLPPGDSLIPDAAALETSGRVFKEMVAQLIWR